MRDRTGAKKRRAISKFEAIHESDPPSTAASHWIRKQPPKSGMEINQSTFILDPGALPELHMARATLSFLEPTCFSGNLEQQGDQLASCHQLAIGSRQERLRSRTTTY
jgi:hypothetical protein